jgi:hypothetical protein
MPASQPRLDLTSAGRGQSQYPDGRAAGQYPPARQPPRAGVGPQPDSGRDELIGGSADHR